MRLTAPAVATILASIMLCAVAQAQSGPSDPEIIAGAPTAKISHRGKKLEGQVTATVRVGEDGRVRDVLVTENSTDGLEQELVKVLQSARFRPAIDASGRPVEGSIEMQVELRESTGAEPRPVRAKPDAQLADKEKARIKRMRCSDFLWEWKLLREESDDPAAIEFMPRMATAMYASMRSEAGDYVDAKVWKASGKALREAADQCEENPGAPFWDGIFKSVMDEAVPK
jgi:TonB family protein